MRQLIFTSALAGLDRGRSGFCTVARHASLRARTIAELEKMSAYEPPEGTRPTVFLFRVYSGGSEPLYILTRAGDAGTDPFGRPNCVVHHLIFRRAEIGRLFPPAETALRFRGWCEKFEGSPRFLPEDESLPPEILRGDGESLLPARRWKELTGDAGNAALLCPRGDPRATVFVGDDFMTEEVLGLFAESAETLGAASAWEVAFSTGICSKKGAGRFLWRMVGERELAVRHPGDFILDFLAPLSVLRAPKTAFAEFARTGKMPPTDDDGFPLGEDDDADETADSAVPPPLASAPAGKAFAAGVPAKGDAERKRFADIAGTAKFLGISALVVAVVVFGVLLWNPFPRRAAESAPAAIAGTVSAEKDAASVRRGILEARIREGDFAGAAEAWLSFAEAFPQEAEKLRQTHWPRFRLKTPGAYAARVARRLALLDAGGVWTQEEKMLVAADLAMFRRVCRELELTPGLVQKKNAAVFERAEAALAAAGTEKD